MEINSEEIRRGYAELSDEGLLSINPDDLTELARQYYAAEVAGRGLHPESEQEERVSEPNEDLVVVNTFVSSEEAAMARALLRSVDIPAYFDNELTSTWTGIGGLRLMVPRSLLEQSKEILETSISDEELARQADASNSLDGDHAEEAVG